MRKVIFAVATLCLLGCNNKSPEQMAQESVERQQAEWDAHKHYIDSIAYIAFGYEDARNYDKRKEALEILRNEYPDYEATWRKVADSITYNKVFTEKVLK